MPFDMLASQHPGCYTPDSRGMGAILHNQAGNLHSPSISWKMTPSSHTSAASNNIHSSLNHLDLQCIAPSDVQTIPDVQPPKFAPTELTSQDWEHRKTHQFENNPIFDNFLFDSAPYPTVAPMVPADAPRPEADPREPARPRGERLRYHTALRTQTAMVRSADENPISYLNKGQVYGLMVMDLNPPVTTTEMFRYRTFVRVSFDDDEQRSNAALNWQLWQKSHRTNKPHHLDNDCLAVEFAPEVKGSGNMQLEQVSTDGFCVTWTPERANSTKGCNIPLRFNFLSTDFSHSKGVKGIPLRLCAKTKLLSPESARNPDESEVCYCKIKLFRDHGAERKHNNDLRHVQKTITKLEQQIQDVQVGGRFQKRRRANTTSTDMRDSKGLDYADIESSSGNHSTKDSLRNSLAASQDMLASIRTISVLSLRGGKEDDPDDCPLVMTRGKQPEEPARAVDIEGGNVGLPDQRTVEQPSKSSVCFFLKPSDEPNGVFRAIYLTERTAENLKQKICEKYHVDPSKIERLLRIINDELKIIVDDDLVNELPGGQTMIVDICDIKNDIVDGSCLKEIRLKYGDQHMTS